jgi:hypothetical protein
MRPPARRLVAPLLLLPLVASGCGRERRGEHGIAHAGLSSPETVLWDSAADVYLVSNVNGDPGADDGNGFVSRIRPDGKVLSLKWIQGGRRGAVLNGPKGMAILGDSLFVADLGAVRVFDRRTGRPIRVLVIPETTGLNGVAVGPDGRVWVTDLEENAVYRIHADSAIAVASGDDLDHPNGIAADAGGVDVAAFGSAEVYRIANGQRTTVATLPGGSLDGLLRLPDGSLAATSWADNAVYRIDPSGKVSTLVSDAPSPSQIGWDGKRRRLLVPLFDSDEIRFAPIH